MKQKSSDILKEAKVRVLDGRQTYACCAIQDVETDLRYENGGRDVKNNAAKIFAQFKPAHIPENMRASQGWWPKHDNDRIVALDKAIEQALKRGD